MDDPNSKRKRSPKGYNVFCTILIYVFLGTVLLTALLLISRNNSTDIHCDFIITGSGAGGSAAAEVLSRDPRKRVCLFEAGPNTTGDAPVLDDVTPESSTLFTNYIAQFFWQFAQLAAEFIPNRPDLRYTGGRMEGGGTRVNGMMFVRGTDWYWNKVAELTGDSLWDVSNVIDNFKEFENYVGNLIDPSKRGIDGRLTISDLFLAPPQPTPTPMAEKYVTAVEQATGLPRLDDYNRLDVASRVGPFLRYQLTAKYQSSPPMKRQSADIAFLSPDVLKRPNLKVITDAFVTKVLFDGRKTATGIDYIKNGECRQAFAKERVILSAGIQSPVILMHSGIGDATYLNSIGIKTVYDNPNVGIDAYNHQGLSLIFSKNSSDTLSASPSDIYEGGAWLPDPNPDPNVTAGSSPRRIQAIIINTPTIMVYALAHLQPLKTGYVYLQDNNPLRPPLSTDNILVPPEGTIDWDTYVNAIKQFGCKIRDEYQGVGLGPAVDTSYEMLNPPYSYCFDDTQLYEWVRTNLLLQTYHWTSTVKMGIAGDGISVTNSRGSVWGVKKLSVLDASILPHIPDGNTQASAYLVGHLLGKEIAAGRH